jgi:DNA-binding XRE family transcriptional regulator
MGLGAYIVLRMAISDTQKSTYRPFRKFGERLAQARLRAGYASQPAFARVLGMNHNTICRHEVGHVFPLPKVIRRYCEVLRIEESALIYGVGGFSTPPGGVLDFLLSRDAQELLDETRDRLLRVDWSVLCDGPISRDQVELVARLIDRNLRRRGKSLNGELSGGTAAVSEGSRGVYPRARTAHAAAP